MCIWECKYWVCVYGNGNIGYVCMGMDMCVWEWKTGYMYMDILCIHVTYFYISFLG